jgi:hypothetical protein
MSEWQRIFYGGQEIRGRIGAHECHQCGHHELVVEVGDRFYLPLRPGMKIVIEAAQKKSPESEESKPKGMPSEDLPRKK